ncbi:MAG: aminodeoxychorismate synthase component I [Actinobacteria bacterium]|nr:aminodeoxychorismate synthase component I [Actinomycetota bacterium]
MKVLSTITTFDLEFPPFVVSYLLRDSEYLCFLDSSLPSSKYSRFSYIGWDPLFVIKSYGFKNEHIDPVKRKSYFLYEHPLCFLKRQFEKYIFDGKKDTILKIVRSHEKIASINANLENRDTDGQLSDFLVPDFLGGFIGYFSYDLKNFIEVLPSNAFDDINLPIVYLVYFDKLVSYNHMEDIWYYIKNFQAIEGESNFINPLNDTAETASKIDEEVNEFKEMIYSKFCGFEKNPVNLSDLIKNGIIEKYLERKIDNISLVSNFSRDKYLRAIAVAKNYIHNGDIYQVNLSQRFEGRLGVEPADLYYILRRKNPAPFSAYLSFPEVKVASSSPERFLFLKNKVIHTRPIKGTRPRGKDSREDEKQILALKNSTKDRAELNMIVDLERNDLGKICYYGTVRVREHGTIEKYARVFHSVSTVEGRVKNGVGVVDILKATFPGGSITGAPKIRAMEIIDELEPNVRSIYTGSIGYIGVDFTMDLNIAIRTFIIRGDKFYYSVGGGIVEDSVPEEEYQETLDKGAALLECLKFFESKNLEAICF